MSQMLEKAYKTLKDGYDLEKENLGTVDQLNIGTDEHLLMPDISDVRESPGLKLMALLEGEEGARVNFHDPFVPVLPATRAHPSLTGRSSVDLDPQTVRAHDVVVIVTDHSNIDYESLAAHSSLIIDTRNAMRDVAGGQAEVVKA